LRRKFGNALSLEGMERLHRMGDVISIEERRQALPSAASRTLRRRLVRTTFSFDLLLPQTYLAAERVDQMFPGVHWQPASAEVLWGGAVPFAALIEAAEQRAATLAAPLVWPEAWPQDVRPAMRAAALASELGRGAPFVLAAGRLAFCGGFDLGDPEVLAEAAAAAGVPLDPCLAAAGDQGRDGAIEDAGRRLLATGADELPVLRVGRRLFSGEARLPEAVAAASASA
jgi:2-hydroxychromene-2-carboxylate isomerase